MSKFNVSDMGIIEFRKLFTPISYELHLYAIPFFLTFGLIGNPVAFIVWISRKLRRNNSSAIYMAMLAINDFFCNLLTIIYYLTNTWELKIIDFPVLCPLFHVTYIIFQYNSLPLVFGFTLERWIAVCYPFKRERCCTENRAWMACALIFTVIFICTIPNSIAWHYKEKCTFVFAENRNMVFFVYQAILEFSISALIPIITIGLNISVIVEMYRISAANRNYPISLIPLNAEDEKTKTERNIKNFPNSHNHVSFKSTTTTLLLVSFFHILTTLPLGVVYISQNFAPNGIITLSYEEIVKDPKWNRHFNMLVAKDMIDMLSMSHYCFNIVIYLGSSQQFRAHLMLLMKVYFTRQDTMNNSINNSYYKFRHTQETNKTEMSLRRQIGDSRKTNNCEATPIVN